MPPSPASSFEGLIAMRSTAGQPGDPGIFLTSRGGRRRRSSLRANLAQGMRRTLPEDSINGDSIEVVRQEGASKDHRGIEALLNADQERRQVGDGSKAKELNQGRRPIRHAEIHREANRDSSRKKAVAGNTDQTRCDHRAPSRSDCGQAGRSGCRGSCRKREGPRHHLTAVPERENDRTARAVLSFPTIVAAPRSEMGRSTQCRSA